MELGTVRSFKMQYVFRCPAYVSFIVISIPASVIRVSTSNVCTLHCHSHTHMLYVPIPAKVIRVSMSSVRTLHCRIHSCLTTTHHVSNQDHLGPRPNALPLDNRPLRVALLRAIHVQSTTPRPACLRPRPLEMPRPDSQSPLPSPNAVLELPPSHARRVGIGKTADASRGVGPQRFREERDRLVVQRGVS